MRNIIVLDSSPLGLIVQQLGVAPADRCREWMEMHARGGTRFIVPEIVDYEVRRELVRLGATSAISRLDAFNQVMPDRYLSLTTSAMRLAADLWAQARKHGKPTADRDALDGDVILAAQVLSAGLKPDEFIVATSNVSHLSQFVPAEPWDQI